MRLKLLRTLIVLRLLTHNINPKQSKINRPIWLTQCCTQFKPLGIKCLRGFGVLQRIKHLLPRDRSELFEKAMVLPILDYADVTWGDKSNTTLMNKIQLLQNKAAKLILNMPKHSSATEALDRLGWDTLEKRRRSHRLFLIFTSLN